MKKVRENKGLYPSQKNVKDEEVILEVSKYGGQVIKDLCIKDPVYMKELLEWQYLKDEPKRIITKFLTC